MKSLETVEFDDQEQVNFFLSQLCEKRSKEKLTAGKVLGVNDGKIRNLINFIKKGLNISRISMMNSNR